MIVQRLQYYEYKIILVTLNYIIKLAPNIYETIIFIAISEFESSVE